ncbi:ComEC/Rec2 family competence protein [Marinobacter changyiensis]|uniref:ComEC/Rec2 family competence protein n=1 Tax=Marinobacter changyiensis TaxID=2604091 RepID=UPI0015D203A4|nr:ComEC/Rec2 family competence protein [Marinobacter changyiensis]
MRAGIAAFSCGVILLYSSGILLPWPELIFGFVVLIMSALLITRQSGLTPAVILLCVGLGLAWANWHASNRMLSALPASAEGSDLVVEGFLCDIPSPGIFNSVRFSFCVSRWVSSVSDANTLPDKLRLAWYGQEATRELAPNLRLTVRLKRANGSVNPAGFRYETWLYRHGFRATGTLREALPLKREPCYLVCQYHQWRNAMAAGLESRLGHITYYPLAEALLIGQRGQMTPAHWQVLQDTGTIHLVAISGLHIGLIAVGLGMLASQVLVRLPQHWLTPSRSRAIAFGLVIAGSSAYALAAGFTVPTRRALMMVVIAGWLVFRAGRTGPWAAWLLAAFAVLLLDPFAPLDRGFWLSFGAVAILILVFSGRVSPPSPVIALVLAQCGVFAGLWPILAIMGQSPAAVGWLANLIAIPWVSLVVMPVLMIGAFLIALLPETSSFVGQVFDGVLGILWWFLELIGSLPAPTLAASFGLALAAAALVLVSLLFPIPRLRLLAVALLAGWLGTSLNLGSINPGSINLGSNDPESSDLDHVEVTNPWVENPELWVWDVGQGLSALFRHQDQVLLYDTGPETPSGFSAVNSVVLPNLAYLGVRKIDTLVISHGDTDHAGGLEELFENITVTRILSGQPERLLTDQPGAVLPDITPCESGKSLLVGEAKVHLWQASSAIAAADSNDASCVVAIRYGATEILLPGDISRNVEQRYIRQVGRYDAEYRILVASHHGSNTSSGQAWIEALAADDVVYSAGYRHRYGHPHENVIARFRAAGTRQLNTAYSGALVFRLEGAEVSVEEWRSKTPFWIRREEDHWIAP